MAPDTERWEQHGKYHFSAGHASANWVQFDTGPSSKFIAPYPVQAAATNINQAIGPSLSTGNPGKKADCEGADHEKVDREEADREGANSEGSDNGGSNRAALGQQLSGK